jgi:hypothetical protein
VEKNEMAQSLGNYVLQGMHGSVGDTTVRIRAGKIIVSKKRRATLNPPSAETVDKQLRFKVCTQYARRAIDDPEKEALYKAAVQPGQNAYNLALRDAYRAPEIQSIEYLNKDAFDGEIIVRATDDFKVVAVTVAIYDIDGLEIEKGEAVMLENKTEWSFHSLKLPQACTGFRITATAVDLPGNQTSSERILA